MIKNVITIAAHGTEVAHVKDGGFLAGCEVFGHSATRVLQRHGPPAEGHDLGTESHVLVVQEGSAIVAHRQQAMARSA
jgi:hypothetical protein